MYNGGMKFSDDDIGRLAKVSGIRLTEGEAKEVEMCLEEVAKVKGLLAEVDTEGVEAMFRVGNLQNVWREDVVEEGGVGREKLLALASDVKDDQVKVPKVL